MLISCDSSYGSVFKAMHKESGQVVAIKQVPVDTDLQEIIKEISMMQQCDRYQMVHYFTVFVLVFIIIHRLFCLLCSGQNLIYPQVTYNSFCKFSGMA